VRYPGGVGLKIHAVFSLLPPHANHHPKLRILWILIQRPYRYGEFGRPWSNGMDAPTLQGIGCAVGFSYICAKKRKGGAKRESVRRRT
jgi:hypothetical protein